MELWLLHAEGIRADPGVLSADERERAARFVRGEDRERFVAFRTALRRVLAGYTGVEPGALVFRAEAGGKPALEGGGIRFNLSHSGGHMALACARGCEVGVDMEEIMRARDVEGVAQRYFHANEQRALRACDADARGVRFLEFWTAKEAWLKALGLGLHDGLASLDMSAIRRGVCARVSGGAAREGWLWAFGDEAARGAVVALGAPGRVTVRRSLP